MDPTHPLLVCFALKEEAKYFNPASVPGSCYKVVVGMGWTNASRGFRQALSTGVRPRFVVTAGIAGGLNPALQPGDVVFNEDPEIGLAARLGELGAKAAVFHCSKRVATTVAEKMELRQSTGADVVEMESGIIRAICREKGIPGITIRIISDAAHEALPLDFNALMTADDRINYAKLALKLLSAPGKIPELMRFQKQSLGAARKLGDLLHGALQATEKA